MDTRKRVDFNAVREELRGRCFICEMLAGNPEYQHHVVYEDERAVAFLNRYPSLYGYALVAPKDHREQVTGDFSLDEYLHLQAVVHRVAEAIRQVVPTERLYVLSLGSQQANPRLQTTRLALRAAATRRALLQHRSRSHSGRAGRPRIKATRRLHRMSV